MEPLLPLSLSSLSRLSLNAAQPIDGSTASLSSSPPSPVSVCDAQHQQHARQQQQQQLLDQVQFCCSGDVRKPRGDSFSDRVIELNVGGTKYSTSLETLRMEPGV